VTPARRSPIELARRAAVGLAAAVALGAAAPAAGAAEPPELVVVAPARLAQAAERVRGFDRSRLATAMELTGLDRPGPPIRVVLATETSPEARAMPYWVAGYARGAEGVVVLFPARAPTYPDDSLEGLLHHEVAHVLLTRATRGRQVPRWFNEGVATAAGHAWGFGDRTRFGLELLRGGRVPLDDLDRRFAGGGAEAASAYAVAGAFVRDLLRRHGPGVTGDILRRVGAGESFSRAFYGATGVTRFAAEASFWRRQTFWGRWVPFLTSSVALWIAVTALALWAFKRRRDRDLALAAAWEAEERAAAVHWDSSAVPPEDEPRIH
jgi:hypothetical protein